jgi:hypothetical protein
VCASLGEGDVGLLVDVLVQGVGEDAHGPADAAEVQAVVPAEPVDGARPDPEAAGGLGDGEQLDMRSWESLFVRHARLPLALVPDRRVLSRPLGAVAVVAQHLVFVRLERFPEQPPVEGVGVLGFTLATPAAVDVVDRQLLKVALLGVVHAAPPVLGDRHAPTL